jgi:hypothetical protein
MAISIILLVVIASCNFAAAVITEAAPLDFFKIKKKET